MPVLNRPERLFGLRHLATSYQGKDEGLTTPSDPYGSRSSCRGIRRARKTPPLAPHWIPRYLYLCHFSHQEGGVLSDTHAEEQAGENHPLALGESTGDGLSLRERNWAP